MKSLVLGFAGLTHLGIISTIASAARGFQVIGYHDDAQLVAALNRRELHVQEPQLKSLLVRHMDRLAFVSSPAGFADCDIVYISVDIPTDENGVSDLAPIRSMIDEATSKMRADAILVVLCQVPPGFTRSVVWPETQLFYQVETLVFGRAVDRALHPERFILGCAHPLQPVEPRLLCYLEAFACPILPMCYESAELAKISINMFLVASVTAANTLAELCEQVGADWADIMPSLRLDKRIGKHAYLNPGLGIAGGNLERDLATVLSYAEYHGTDASVVSAWVAHSIYCKNWALRKLNTLILSQMPAAKIALLGLTYKEGTHSTKNSAGLELLGRIPTRNVTAFDPYAADDVTDAEVIRAQTAIEAIEGADVLLIMTPWPQFKDITGDQLLDSMVGRVIIDPYRMLDREDLAAKGFTYAALGAPVDSQGLP